MRSVRSRIILGALLWTIGITTAVHLVSLFLIRHFPSMAMAHYGLMAIVATGLIVAGLTQARSGLSPLDRLRAQLAAMREGRERRVAGDYPAEVQPLVDDLNALLDDRERRVTRALARAGDFAHGLKTPLAVLSQEAERAEAAGHRELARVLDEQVTRMRRQVDYHLAHARASAVGATPGARAPVLDSAAGLVRALQRLHADRGLEIHIGIAPGHVVRVQRVDLDEMLGNLLDNACKWARSRVTVESAEAGPELRITVEDDGRGLDPSQWDVVLQRGVRVDQAAPGSGLGLAIASDLAEVYGGRLSLGRAAAGGLRAELRLPAG